MSDYLFLMESRLSPEQWKTVLQIQERAADLGMNLYLVGGVVRDLVAGLPIDDLDFVVEGRALKLVHALNRQGTQLVWQSSTLQAAELEFPSGVLASISMARSETYPKPALPPKVAPAPIVVDLKRRDFSMNAIGVSLSPNSRGLLLDPANGLADIEKKEIRTLHSYSFYDDPVRLFRAVRLRARLRFTWDAKTAAQFENARAEGLPNEPAGEALALELRQLARERNPAEILKALEKEKLLPALSPRLHGSAINWQGIAKATKASHVLARAGLRAPSFALFLHLLLHKLPGRDQAQLAKRLRIKQSQWNLGLKLEANAKRLAKDLGGKAGGTPTKLYQLLSKTPPDLLLLLMTGHSQGKIQSRLKAYLDKYLPLRARLPEKELQDLKVPPGSARFQKILDAYFYAVIEGELRTHNQQMRFLARLAQQKQ